MRPPAALAAALALCAFVAAPAVAEIRITPKDVSAATEDDDSALSAGDDSAIADPLEDVNRGVFAFNEVVDGHLLKPVAAAWRDNAPDRAQSVLHNFVSNLLEPWTFVNDLLQGNPGRAADTLGRFAINTTYGLGGAFDVLGDEGNKKRSTDFGETLGAWGVGGGAYLVLPLLGPSSLRDGVGEVADMAGDPVSWATGPIDPAFSWARVGGSGLDKRVHHLDDLDDLEKNSIDYYAALRSAWWQMRQAEIKQSQEAR
jgi:phospholipid-binding lipoprotein MlaA